MLLDKINFSFFLVLSLSPTKPVNSISRFLNKALPSNKYEVLTVIRTSSKRWQRKIQKTLFIFGRKCEAKLSNIYEPSQFIFPFFLSSPLTMFLIIDRGFSLVFGACATPTGHFDIACCLASNVPSSSSAPTLASANTEKSISLNSPKLTTMLLSFSDTHDGSEVRTYARRRTDDDGSESSSLARRPFSCV